MTDFFVIHVKTTVKRHSDTWNAAPVQKNNNVLGATSIVKIGEVLLSGEIGGDLTKKELYNFY